MARTFTGTDVHPWKVCTHSGAVLSYRDAKDGGKVKRAVGLSGYKEAAALARLLDGVAVRQ
jgi:hypothetical protein